MAGHKSIATTSGIYFNYKYFQTPQINKHKVHWTVMKIDQRLRKSQKRVPKIGWNVGTQSETPISVL